MSDMISTFIHNNYDLVGCSLVMLCLIILLSAIYAVVSVDDGEKSATIWIVSWIVLAALVYLLLRMRECYA